MEPKALLRSLFDAAVRAAMPQPSWFQELKPPNGRTVVIGAGKAAASMARAFESAWDAPFEGVVVTRYGHALPTDRVQVLEAAHPVPDLASVAAAEQILASVRGLTSDDLVVALISGGGSSVLTLPADGVTLEEKQALSRELLRSGASIAEINAVRKALSKVKGGRLLAACQPARVVTFVVSDVPGDDPSVIASGPTLPDYTPTGEARAVMDRYAIPVSSAVQAALDRVPEKAVSNRDAEVHLMASAQHSLEAAARRAGELGLPAFILSDAIEGEAREVAKVHAALAKQVRSHHQPFKTPCVLLSGGETTVTVRGNGRGGRNVEFLAALANELRGTDGIFALAADTDGVDGAEEVAGAIIDPTTVVRAGQHLREALEDNDAHSLFERLGDQVITGPTHTNVNDFRAILVQ